MLRYLETGVSEASEANDTIEDKWNVLYRKIEEGKYEFVGLHDPEIPDEDYPDGLYAINFTSVFSKTVPLAKGTHVWNVEGSTGDTWNGKKCNDWIGVWKSKVPGGTVKCYVKESPGSQGNVISCNTPIVGGHMIKTNVQPVHGDDDKVYILPICNAHNNYHNKNMMTVCENVTAVLLKRYYCDK